MKEEFCINRLGEHLTVRYGREFVMGTVSGAVEAWQKLSITDKRVLV
jgi:hypothetical protein